MQIESKNFKLRVALENYIRSEIGDDIQANRAAGHKIVGTEGELKRLGLSPKVSVFGIKCEITN